MVNNSLLMAKSHDAYIEINILRYSKITLHSHVHIKNHINIYIYIHGHHHSPSFTIIHHHSPVFTKILRHSTCPLNKKARDTSTSWILWMDASTSCSEVTSPLLMASAILVADHWRKASPRLHGRGLEDSWRLLENDWNHWWEKEIMGHICSGTNEN